jgi:hypothetical protein
VPGLSGNSAKAVVGRPGASASKSLKIFIEIFRGGSPAGKPRGSVDPGPRLGEALKCHSLGRLAACNDTERRSSAPMLGRSLDEPRTVFSRRRDGDKVNAWRSAGGG